MYQSRLVPRALPDARVHRSCHARFYHTAVVSGLLGEGASALALLAVLPIATWEFGLGVYLAVKGFRPSAVAELDTVPAVPGSPWPGPFRHPPLCPAPEGFGLFPSGCSIGQVSRRRQDAKE